MLRYHRGKIQAGIYSTLSMNSSQLVVGKRYLGDSVYVAVEGLDYGIGMILHLEDDITATLEGYAVGPENTSQIAFNDVRFAIGSEPGPLLKNGS